MMRIRWGAGLIGMAKLAQERRVIGSKSDVDVVVQLLELTFYIQFQLVQLGKTLKTVQ